MSNLPKKKLNTTDIKLTKSKIRKTWNIKVTQQNFNNEAEKATSNIP